MEEEIKELKHRIEVLSGVVFIILKETGMLEKAMQDNALLRTVVEKTVGREEGREEGREVKDKSISKQKEDEFTSILKDFDAKDAIKN